MTEIRFYHLQRARLEDVLPVILERCYQRGERAWVLAGSDERVEALAALLWTYRPEAFLPHGTPRDGDATRQPIYISAASDGDAAGGRLDATSDSAAAGDTENPNRAAVLVLSDGARHRDVAGFRLVCELFDGHDEAAVTAARGRWRGYKESGHAVVYYQQAESGKWQETARA